LGKTTEIKEKTSSTNWIIMEKKFGTERAKEKKRGQRAEM
jgi:hypothetical protein